MSYLTDLASFICACLLIAGYQLFLYRKVKKDPTYTVQSINHMARAMWVETMMQSGKPDVLPIQTLRNSTMAATFLASTAILLIMGVLTLSSQSQGVTWRVLDVYGSTHHELWAIKLLALLSDLLVAFFSFAMAIRIYHHVGYLINVPVGLNHKSMTPQHVAIYLNSAGKYYSVGMRAYYYCVPLVFWLFGPAFMLLMTLIVIFLMYRNDRAAKVLAEDFK